MAAELVITHGKVITVDEENSIREAVAVEKGRIVAVGSHADMAPYIGPATRVLDLKGKPMLPGINDTHMHGPYFGATRPPLALDLSAPSVTSIEEMVTALQDKVAKTQPGEWIRGFGWDVGTLKECKHDPSRMPRKSDIDAVSPDNPVVFNDFSGHTLLVNSKALEVAGINAQTPAPPSGEMERDPATGEPTGLFKEPAAIAMVSAHIPLLTREEKRQAVLTAVAELNKNGITSFTDAAIGPGGETMLFGVMSGEFVKIYRDLLEEGRLTVRTNVLLLMGDYGALTLDDIKENFDTFPIPNDTDPHRLKFSGVKMFADGVPLTGTSWMNEPYVAGGHGDSVVPGSTETEKRKNLKEMVNYVHAKGFMAGIHATGDRAVDAAAEAFMYACDNNPGVPVRHQLIHGDFMDPETTRALSKYPCGVSMQPAIGAMISDFEPAVVGAERAAKEFPARMVQESGLVLTFSCDAPVTLPNWRQGVQAAVLRENAVSGRVSGPEERITREEAIRAYTINGAWQDNMEREKGSIEVGKLADFCILGEDILTVEARRIGEIPVLATVFNGEIVFDESNGLFEA
ncbi:amidohydrolase [Desulfoluna spongiiphila]|uniref:Amidohydrolase 3 domain-containing protein n=1 Tax=Desulfoluna spongiiphila TaxID=419481 RepID=A0A1G5BUM1_9BACT|nr:amidohydrolase [Desulfoluna spongiiphila]SCX93630.1 hypothetical protein SAMN05216233_102194 [Desulfoluna spongiiphila]